MISSLYTTFQFWSATGSVYVFSDTHFEDPDTELMNPKWIKPEEQIDILKKMCHKSDTLILLGDIGNPEWLKQLKCRLILISGNHDKLGQLKPYFDEVYDGPLFISDKILLSHEPIYGLEEFCVNIHGHCHNGESTDTHINMAADVCNYTPMNLGKFIKDGGLSGVHNYHRLTIDRAAERKEYEKKNN